MKNTVKQSCSSKTTTQSIFIPFPIIGEHIDNGNKIIITREELETILSRAYQRGYTDGNVNKSNEPYYITYEPFCSFETYEPSTSTTIDNNCNCKKCGDHK